MRKSFLGPSANKKERSLLRKLLVRCNTLQKFDCRVILKSLKGPFTLKTISVKPNKKTVRGNLYSPIKKVQCQSENFQWEPSCLQRNKSRDQLEIVCGSATLPNHCEVNSFSVGTIAKFYSHSFEIIYRWYGRVQIEKKKCLIGLKPALHVNTLY